MKGNNLYVLVLLADVIALVILMYIFSGGTLMSWSIADATSLAFMLRMLLFPIVRLLWKFGEKHVEREKFLIQMVLPQVKFLKWYKPRIFLGPIDFKLKDVFEISGWLFAGIIIFGMGGTWPIKIIHWIVTGAAAASIFIIVVRSTPKGIKRTLYIAGMSIGTFIWILGITTKLWSVYLGEAAYMITPILFFISEIVNNKLSQDG